MDSVVYHVIKSRRASHPLKNAIQSQDDATVRAAGRLSGHGCWGGLSLPMRKLLTQLRRGDLWDSRVSDAGFSSDY